MDKVETKLALPARLVIAAEILEGIGGQSTMAATVREAAAALSGREAVGDGWRPIAEAPKDGTLFLCWVSAERWSQEDGGGSGRSADTSEVDFGQWRDFETGGAFFNMMGQIGDMQDITHWQPLPAAPSAKGVAS